MKKLKTAIDYMLSLKPEKNQRKNPRVLKAIDYAKILTALDYGRQRASDKARGDHNGR